jgi:hypothetical protein
MQSLNAHVRFLDSVSDGLHLEGGRSKNSKIIEQTMKNPSMVERWDAVSLLPGTPPPASKWHFRHLRRCPKISVAEGYCANFGDRRCRISRLPFM